MVDYSIWTAESLGEQTFTDTAYAEKATLDFTTTAATGDYLILAQWMYCTNNATYSIVTRVQLDDTTTIHEGWAEPAVAGPTNEYRSGSVMYVAEDLANGDHYLDLDAYIESGATGYLKNVRFVVIRLDAKLTTSGMYGYVASEGSTTITATAGTAQTLTTLNITPDTTGDYLILGYTELDANSTSYSGYVTLNVVATEDLPVDSGMNTTGYAFLGHEAKDASDWMPFTWGGIYSLTSGASRSIILEGYRSSASGSPAMRKNRIFAVRLAAMSTYIQSNEVTTETSGTNSSYSSSTYRAQISWSPSIATNWVVLGGMVFSSSSTTYSAYARIQQTAGTSTETVNEGIKRPKQVGTTTTQQDSDYMFGVVYKSLAVSTTQTFQTQYMVASGGTNYVRNAFLVAFPMTDTPTVTNYFDDTSNAHIKTTSSFDDTSNAHIKTTSQFDKYSNANIKIESYFDDTSNAHIKGTSSFDHTSNSHVKTTSQFDYTSNASVEIINSFDQTSNAHIKSSAQFDYTSNASIKGQNQFDQTSNAHIKTTSQFDQTSNAHIVVTSSFNNTSNAHVKGTSQFDYTSNASIKGQNQFDQTSNAHVKTTAQFDYTSNANVVNSYEFDKTSNAHIKGTSQFDYTSNAVVKKTSSFDYLSNASIVNTNSFDKTSNSHIKTTSSFDDTSNAHIKGTSQFDDTSNAHIKTTSSFDDTSNAVIKRVEEFSKYSNAHIKSVESFDHVSNAHIKNTYTFDKTSNARVRIVGEDVEREVIWRTCYINNIVYATSYINNEINKTSIIQDLIEDISTII